MTHWIPYITTLLAITAMVMALFHYEGRRLKDQAFLAQIFQALGCGGSYVLGVEKMRLAMLAMGEGAKRAGESFHAFERAIDLPPGFEHYVIPGWKPLRERERERLHNEQVEMAKLEARLRVRAGLELAFPDLVLPPFHIRP